MKKYKILTPCKIGDIVYMPWKWYGTNGIAILKVMYISAEYKIIFTDFYSKDKEYWQEYNYGLFEFNQIGKKIFLTYDEAKNNLLME